jgi:CRISPR-associated protein Cas2
MVVFILERVTPSLRGEITRWCIEPRVGVFVGALSAMVREKLWEKIQESASRNAGGIMLWKTNTEQGYKLLSFGDTSRKITDWDGLLLVTKP